MSVEDVLKEREKLKKELIKYAKRNRIISDKDRRKFLEEFKKSLPSHLQKKVQLKSKTKSKKKKKK